MATVYTPVCTTNLQTLIVICCINFHMSRIPFPYSWFLSLHRLCREDSDFPLKSEEMWSFLNERGYPASVVRASHHCTQQIDWQLAKQISQKENKDRIPFTPTLHPHSHTVKSIILKNFKMIPTLVVRLFTASINFIPT